MGSQALPARRARAGANAASAARASVWDQRFLAVLGCFFLSGFAGLLYETAWTRQFALVFGTSELAVVTVLAGYFGGLSLGAALAGRYIDRITRPILTYGLLELGVAVSAIGLPFAIGASTQLYVSIFGGASDSIETGGLVTAGFYLVCSFVILLVPTAMMGATLPLLARYAVTDDRQIGPRVGLLYAVNTLGAVAGTLVAAFMLLPSMGLGRTIWVGVAANLFVFLVAAWMAKQSAGATMRTSSQGSIRQGPAIPDELPRAKLILPIMLVSGAASFSYEVLWTRLLGHVLGASVFAFATMLASFLTGIALGSAAGSRLARSRSGSMIAFGVVQFCIATASLLSYALLAQLPDLARTTGAGVHAGLAANAAICAMILLPGAFFIGATFPLAVRILAREVSDAGASSARVYAWNTIGAIGGSIASGVLLLPMLHFGGTIVATVAVNLGLMAMIALLMKPVGKRSLGVCAAGVALLVFVRPDEPWDVLRNSALGRDAAGGEVSYYGVGRSTTVLLVDDGLGWDLRTSGLPEANIRRKGVPLGRVLIQQWQNALPVLARPNARTMMFVGLGGGVAVESVPTSIERIDVVELEPEVIAANQLVSDQRAIDPLADPRVRLMTNDARNALLLSRTQYDVIVSQPSHPWTAGASHLYTREFMSMVRDRLGKDGVFLQWMSLAFVDESLLRSLVATLVDVFTHVEMYAPYPGAVLFLASSESLRAWESAAAAIEARPEDFALAGIVCAEDVLAALELDADAARLFAAGAAIVTDDFNLLQLQSRRLENETRSSWQITDAALAASDPAMNPEGRFNAAYLVRKLMTRANSPRALRVAESVKDPALRALCLGHVRDWEGKAAESIAQFETALREKPDFAPAIFGAVRARSAELLRRHPAQVALAERLGDPARAVIDGWQTGSGGSWQALRALDERLASAGPTEDWYVDAQRLRARWRIQSGEPALCREATEILDGFIPRFGSADDFLMRADASLAAGEEIAALGALHEAAQMLRKNSAGTSLAQKIMKRLEKLSPHVRASEAGRRTVTAIAAIPGTTPSLPKFYGN
jgi:spermidine synthase